MNRIGPESIVMVTTDQVSCDLAGEAIILNMRDGTYYGLDPIAARIWDLVQERRTVATICDALLGEYAVPVDRCEHEVIGLLEQLVDRQLIEVSDAPAV